MTAGEFADIDPHAFVVHEGKLYLNKNESARDLFLKSLDFNAKRMDIHWSNYMNHIPADFICDKLAQGEAARFFSGIGVHARDQVGTLLGLTNGITGVLRHLTQSEEAEEVQEAFVTFAFDQAESRVSEESVAVVCKEAKRKGSKYKLFESLDDKSDLYFSDISQRDCRYISYDLYNVYVTLGGRHTLQGI